MDRDFRLRPPVATESEELAALHVHCWRQTYEHLLPDCAFSEEAFQARLRMWAVLAAEPDEGRTIRIVEQSGKIVGFAGSGVPQDGSFEPRRLELYFLYLDQDFHGSGLGQDLLDAVIGDEPASLWVAEENPRARAFYTRNRFSPDGESIEAPEFPGFRELKLVR